MRKKERFQEKYPKEGSGVSEQEFPNFRNLNVIGKDMIIPKIKRIKASFCKAIGSGRMSGGGRVVSALYKESIEIWAGSQAVENFSAFPQILVHRNW